MHKRLSKLDDWKLSNKRQDIRGHQLMDAEGHPLGTVDDLIVNTDRSLVERIVLEDGSEYAAEEIEIDDQQAYLKGTAPAPDGGAPVVRTYDDAHVEQGHDSTRNI